MVRHLQKSLYSMRWEMVEWLTIFLVAYFYSNGTLLNFDANMLQQTGEHNESATRLVLAEFGLLKHGEIPLWNPFMQTGMPLAGDLLSHFWSPLSTIPVLLWGGINGMKVSVFLALLLAGLGQWYLGRLCGLKGIFRLWSALTLMLSGGLAMFWRVGWYELLLGACCFPWAIGAFWHALQKKDNRSLVWASFWYAMVLLTAGGYYPFYLAGISLVLLGVALIYTKFNRRIVLLRTLWAFLLTTGLIAVMALPLLDGFRLISRVGGLDVNQTGSQPVLYAVFNYVIYNFDWFNATLLGTNGGWNWFYLGGLSIVGLIFLPLAFRNRHTRASLVCMGVLLLFLLMWEGNQFTFFHLVYDWIPFLQNLRFPNRLLVIAAIPILILSAAALQGLYTSVRKQGHDYKLELQTSNRKVKTGLQTNLRPVITLAFLMVFIGATLDVFAVNQGFAFAARPLEENAVTTLAWLKKYDQSLYYTWIGGFGPYWSWLSVAYEDELPVINFIYSEQLNSASAQNQPGSAFMATQKYQVLTLNEPPPAGTQLIYTNEGVGVYYFPNALPFAFSTAAANLNSTLQLTSDLTKGQIVHYDGPNRIVVTGAPGHNGDTLVVLVSDYPGWRLLVDGSPAAYTPVNGYLGASMTAGSHTYTFIFDPWQPKVGLSISILTILIAAALLGLESYRDFQKRKALPGMPDPGKG